MQLTMNSTKTGFPSKDRPWLKFYTEEQIQAKCPDISAYAYLKEQNKDRLDMTALDHQTGKVTYRELFSKIEETAGSLAHFGIRPGRRIMAQLFPMDREVYLMYGTNVLGAVMCQVSPANDLETVIRDLKHLEAELFFVCSPLLPPEGEAAIYAQTQVRHIVCIPMGPFRPADGRTLSWEAFVAAGAGETVPETQHDPAAPFFFVSTGGSTGEPKCVMYNDRTFNAAVHQYIHSPHIYKPGHRWLRDMPLFMGAMVVACHHLPLCCGMEVVIRDMMKDYTVFPERVLAEHLHHLAFVPPLFDAMCKSEAMKGADLSYVVHAGVGAMAVTPQFEERTLDFFKEHRIDTFLGYGWGCTESGTVGTFRSDHATTRFGTTGVPFVQTVVAAFDPETGAECGYGQEGELCICSAGMMLGYYNDPELTEKVLREHPDGSRWLHTGDLGFVDGEGFVTVSGRLTRFIFTRLNKKIYPSSIEKELCGIEGVEAAAFVSVDDPVTNVAQETFAFIVPKDMAGAEAVKAAVRAYCDRKYSPDIGPGHIVVKERLPLNSSRKINVQALTKEAQSLAAQHRH